MAMEITLGPADRVDARFDGHVLATDQDGSRPAPFELFLASIGTCAGIYVSRFCRKRGIPAEGIRLLQTPSVDPGTGMVARIDLEIHLPPGFPDAYRDAVARSAGLCAVKRHLESPPEIVVRTSAPATV
jgi:ribosomal protein S12 methylthiotransferase accessory factor